MQITIDIQGELLERAKQRASQTGRPLRTVVEEGLRLVLAAPPQGGYMLPDLSVGSAGCPDPSEGYSWPRLRLMIYGESERL